MKDYLVHHGVKGQQWGVRNGPPYPIEDKVLKKGTKINSISGKYISSKDYQNNGKWMYTYRADEDWDNAVYKGPFAQYLVMYRGAQWLKEHQFETVQDLKMPNRNERVSEFKDMLNDPKYSKIVKNDLDSVQKQLVKYKIGNEEQQKRYTEFNSNKINNAQDVQTAYEIFNHAMEAVHSYGSTQEYAKRMSKKYDAMVDDNNVNIYNDAHDPIIIFRADKALKDIGDGTSYLTVDQILKNRSIVEEKLRKEGKNVKL